MIGGLPYNPMRRSRYMQTVLLSVMVLAGAVLARPEQTAIRAMWCWDVRALLGNAEEQDACFAFCRREGVGVLWLQVPHAMDPPFDSSIVTQRVAATLGQPDDLRDLLRRAHAAGLAVHALDGYPDYALARFHAFPLALVDAILAFNRDAPPDARYDGIHFDIEPYLLVEWHDPARRESLLADYLVLQAACMARVHSQTGLVYGADIPFWWQRTDSGTGRAIGDASFGGRREAASYAVIRMLDNVGIMNYRDTAEGNNGMIRMGEDLLAFADREGRARIYMGVETVAFPPREVRFALGRSEDKFRAIFESAGGSAAGFSRLGGFRVHVMDDGHYVHVGLETPAEAGAAFDGAMARLAAQFGLPVPATPARVIAQRESAARRHIRAERAEWTSFRAQPVVDAKTGAQYAGFVTTNLTPPNITFADDGPAAFHEQTTLAEAAFRQHASFEAMAVHHYRSYRILVGPSAPPAIK